MRYANRGPASDAPEPAQTPTKCPECASSEVKTTSKVVTAASYWRCEKCGEVWNVGRTSAASRYGSSYRFSRR